MAVVAFYRKMNIFYFYFKS